MEIVEVAGVTAQAGVKPTNSDAEQHNSTGRHQVSWSPESLGEIRSTRVLPRRAGHYEEDLD
jgi:hypothetical protein